MANAMLYKTAADGERACMPASTEGSSIKLLRNKEKTYNVPMIVQARCQSLHHGGHLIEMA